MKKLFSLVAVLLFASVCFGQATQPTVYSTSIDYTAGVITVTGKGFEPASSAPTVKFNNVVLSPTSVSDTSIVSPLQSGLTNDVYLLKIINSVSNEFDFAVAYGATGPVGPTGATGPQGAVGFNGAPGATGATGPQGAAGATGAQGPAGNDGAVGPQGPDGLQGPAGISPFQGIFSTSAIYQAGQEVLRPASLTPDLSNDGASIGPYFNLTGVTGNDPSTDSVNWLYVAGVPKGPSSYGPGYGPNGSLSAAANNFTIPAGEPGNAICYPANGVTSSTSVSPNCASGSAGTATLTTRYTTIGFMITPPAPTGSTVEIFWNDITTGNNNGFCAISAGQTSCSGPWQGGVVHAGDSIAVGIRIFGASSFTISTAAWTIQ